MGTRSQLEKKIENKAREIFEMEQAVMSERAFLAGMQEALKMLPKDDTNDERTAEQILRPGSDMAKAREYLQRIGKPMHVVEILKGIGKEVNTKTRVSIGGSLGNYARKQLIFRRTAPNTYGLIELVTNNGTEPPDDFGMDEKGE